MPTDVADTEDTFDNGAPDAVPQLRALESFLDPITMRRIAPPTGECRTPLDGTRLVPHDARRSRRS
jgi:hypothetical protein